MVNIYKADLIYPLLVKKGIKNKDLLETLFDSSLEKLVSWRAWGGFDEIFRILGKEEPVLVWGHDDADGYTSIAITLYALRTLGIESYYFAPDRRKEGHGLNIEKLEELTEKFKIKVVISVDSGISDIEPVDFLKKKNIKVILTDHHELPKSLPNADVILNPKMEKIPFYPYLAGVGIAFKLVWALLEKFREIPLAEFPLRFPNILTYTMIGTKADKVPLASENRILVHEGEKTLSLQPPPTFSMLMKNGQYLNNIDYFISIVSSGERIGDFKNSSVELLISENEELIKSILAKHIERVKSYRDEAEKVYLDSLRILREPRNYILLIFEDLDPRYLGFVASRLKEDYNLPTIVMTRREDSYVAEVRTPFYFDSIKFLEELSTLFVSWGGHKYASGFSIHKDDLPYFVEDVENYFRNFKPNWDEIIDNEFSENEFDLELHNLLKELNKRGLDFVLKVPFTDFLKNEGLTNLGYDTPKENHPVILCYLQGKIYLIS